MSSDRQDDISALRSSGAPGLPKLVRDGIPAAINSRGARASGGPAPSERSAWLARKLLEEAREASEAPSAEELGDLLEVLLALGDSIGVGPEEIEAARRAKRERLGSFDRTWILRAVQEPE